MALKKLGKFGREFDKFVPRSVRGVEERDA